MPCPNCPVDKLSSKGGCSWECCYCKQGYNSYRYDTSCTNCGHGGPSASTGLDTVPTEIDVRQVEAQQPDPHPRVDLSLFPKRENEMALLPPDPEARKDGILSNKEVSASTPRHTVESRDELPTKLLPVLDELQHKSPEESSTTSAVSILELSEETEDNSNTDYSDTELTGVRTVREYIRDRARNLVDHLMKNLRFEFDFDTAIIRCTSGQTNESANSSSQPPSSNVGGATVLEPARRTKIRKVREGEKDNSDDESEKKPPKRRKGKSKVESPPLACLFFKRNPRLCTRNRCCSETGWVTIHRLR
jgi:hypothetical protein